MKKQLLLQLLAQLLLLAPPGLLAAATAPAVVVFPSGEEYTSLVDQSPPGYEDPEDTGSLAFVRRPENARLAIGLPLADWCGGDAPHLRTFRAHPDLIACLADIDGDLQRLDGDRISLARGFLSLKNTGGSPGSPPPFPLNFHAAGTAALLVLRSGRAGAQRRLSAAFARACASHLTAAGWDFGLVAGPAPNPGSLLVLLQSRRRPAALLFRAEASSEFADSAALEAWTRDQWELGFLAAGVNATAELGACSLRRTLDPLNLAPPENIVGPADELATPPDSPDFLRLMQYPAAGLVEFPGCPKLTGSWHEAKCPSRLMSARMYASMRRLHALMSHQLPGWRLRVTAGWASPDGDSPSLRSEGRQLDLTPIRASNGGARPASSLDAALEVAKVATCAGFEYVSVDTATDPTSPRIVLAVIKQARPRRLDDASRPAVLFQQVGHLTPVEPPARLAGQYQVTGMDSAALANRPLFDGALDPETPLGSYARLGMFVSRSHEFRYFRLHPALTACYDSLVEQAGRRQHSTPRDPPVGFHVLRAFLTEFEERALLEPASDPRVGAHPEGLAMQLAYDAASPGYQPGRHTVWHLAEAVASACAPKFHEHRGLFGIGVYNDSVYVDIRPIPKVWLECEPETSAFTTCALTPPSPVATVGVLRSSGSASDDFKTYLLEKATQAIHGRVVEPLAGADNCEFDRPPQDQSTQFVYQPLRQRPPLEGDDDDETGSATIKAPVSADAAASSEGSGGCISGAASDFCRKSAATRASLVGHLWMDVSTKHLLAGSDRVRQALEDCLLTCASAGCANSTNSLWQERLAACESLAHWLPFDLENDIPGRVSNLYTPGDAELRRLACYSGEHCVDWSPLFSLLNPVLSAWFRPRPDGATKEALYDPEGNPSPLLGIVRRLYGHYARGDVKVWLQNEADIKAMLEELRVLFLYNKHVTSVTLLVLDPRSVNAVASQLENEFGDWLQQACPDSSRSYLTPHRITAAVGRQFAAASEAETVQRGLHPPMDAIDLRNW